MNLEEFIVHFPNDWFKSGENWAIEFIKVTSPTDSNCKYDAWLIDSMSLSYCVTRLSL
jgi:hypothetical protein